VHGRAHVVDLFERSSSPLHKISPGTRSDQMIYK
jgi:hypothetical protein